MRARRFAPFLAAAVLLAAPFAAHAKSARGPSAEDLLTRAAAQAAADAKRKADEERESPAGRIAGFRSGALQLSQWSKVTDLVLSAKPEEAAFRAPAADALLARFDAQDLKDAAVRAVRLDAARALLPLMSQADEPGPTLVLRVLGKWFTREILDSGFKPAAKLADRRKAQAAMTKSLKGKD